MEYLGIFMNDFEHPFAEGWNNYKPIFALYPKLKGVTIFSATGGKSINLLDVIENMSSENQEIWKERVAYFQSRGVDVLNCAEWEASKKKQIYDNLEWGMAFKI